MPHYLGGGPAAAILEILGDALDLMDIGILLLDKDLRARFINNRQAEIFGLSPELLTTRPTFRDLLNYAAANGWFPVNPDELPEYIDRREAAVRLGSISPTRLNLMDGKQLLYSCFTSAGGSRILTYVDISKELKREANDVMALAAAEMRFQTETLEEQAAHLASLAEIADRHACEVEKARKELEARITRQTELESELRRLATTDILTGVLNRAGFLALGQQRLEHATEDCLAVLMLDIDHFKKINDSYGHAAGDAALKHFAATLRSALREVDLLGRLGGEEFAVLIPALSPDKAEALANRLRLKVAESPFQFNNELIEMTVSMGVAEREAADQGIEQMIAKADNALYQAKHSGRNRVMRYHHDQAA